LRNWLEKPWSKGVKIAACLIILALVIGVILLSTVWRPERVDTVEDESCQRELGACQNQSAEKDQEIAGLRQEIVELTTAPNISVEKWVKVNNSCGWQKEISAEKGDWIEVKIVVNVTRIASNVWVRDAGLNEIPWSQVGDLQVDGVPFAGDGDIVEGISLGKLRDESREITFKVLLSKSTYRYDCGVNTLKNTAEAGDCGFEAAVSEAVQIIVDIHCVPPSGDGGAKEDDDEVGPPKVYTDPNG
jgi:hypothetical protein